MYSISRGSAVLYIHPQGLARCALSSANCAVLDSSLNSFLCFVSVSAKVLSALNSLEDLPCLVYPAKPFKGAFSSCTTSFSMPQH